jgi:hypothetical protein
MPSRLPVKTRCWPASQLSNSNNNRMLFERLAPPAVIGRPGAPPRVQLHLSPTADRTPPCRQFLLTLVLPTPCPPGSWLRSTPTESCSVVPSLSCPVSSPPHRWATGLARRLIPLCRGPPRPGLSRATHACCCSPLRRPSPIASAGSGRQSPSQAQGLRIGTGYAGAKRPCKGSRGIESGRWRSRSISASSCSSH